MDLEELLHPTLVGGALWSVRVTGVDDGRVVAEHEPHRMLPTASVAKVFLLVEVAEQLVLGHLDPDKLLDRSRVAPVADSGLWQHLSTEQLPQIDLARLVGAASDNLATNVLLDVVGLDAVQRCANRWAPHGSMLHDIVRDERGPGDPATLSEGCAADWADVFVALGQGRLVGSEVSELVLDWLGIGVDLSMVAAAFGLDPLAHQAADRGVRLWNKTGTSDGVRVDVGLVDLEGRRFGYAVSCHFDEGQRDDVLATMAAIGRRVRAHALPLW